MNLNNDMRRNLARDGSVYSETGKKFNRSYSKKLIDKGQYVDSSGYKRFIDSNKLVHRWIVEKNLGRKLRSDEEVHHINRKKFDNRIKNLQVLTSKQHRRKHFWSKFLTGRK